MSQTPSRIRPSLRRRVYHVIEIGRGEDGASKWFDYFLIALILANITAFCLETVPSIESRWGRWLQAFEVFAVTAFTIEYVLRIWTAVEVPLLARKRPWRARLSWALRPFQVIDLMAILPFYLGSLIGADLSVLRVFRLLRFLKLTRYSPAIHTLLRVLASEKRPLAGAFVLLVAALLIFSTGMYYIEGKVQPEKFGSVPDAAYWAMTTLTTVGYGDVTPVTPMGKLWASLTMLCGLCILALPVAIIATGFATEVGRHDFVLTWSLMSRIPLFAELDTNEVARLMPLMHAKSVSPFTEVIADGAPGDAMFFVASGHVRQTSPLVTHDYRVGDFFGVVAMLQDGQSLGSYRAVARTRLLKLERDDFVQLEAVAPALAEHVRRVAHARQAHRQKLEEEAAAVAAGSIPGIVPEPTGSA
ncbi:MAG: cyclic nucleotide-gated ion channel [Hyphomicrobiaceae bacterium]|nr:cyclic nucleotide-gated ion channel [Hyphomicrobiaceae bacterium]